MVSWQASIVVATTLSYKLRTSRRASALILAFLGTAPWFISCLGGSPSGICEYPRFLKKAGFASMELSWRKPQAFFRQGIVGRRRLVTNLVSFFPGQLTRDLTNRW